MSHNTKKSAPANETEVSQKADGKKACKNQNPNENHNTKKQSMGPNTNR